MPYIAAQFQDLSMMRLIILCWVGFSVGSCGQTASDPAGFAVAVDLGASPAEWPWNGLTNPHSGQISNLMDLTGKTTGIGLEMIEGFADVNTYGVPQAKSALGLPKSVTSDSFWGHALPRAGKIHEKAVMRWTGLEPGQPYVLRVYGSRLADDAGRQTQVVLNGDTVWYDAANNVDAFPALSALATAAGELELTVSAGPENKHSQGLYCLGAMVLQGQGVAEPAGLTGEEPVHGARWQRGSEVRLNWQNLTGHPVEIWAGGADHWQHLGTAPAWANSFPWHIPLDFPAETIRIRLVAAFNEWTSSREIELGNDLEVWPIVVLGSSTAAGAGASVSDSSWVSRFRTELSRLDTRFSVVNLAKGGYTTRHVKAEGEGMDSLRNIQMALSLCPSAIVVNLPSNDAAKRIPFEETANHFRDMDAAARDAGVPIWWASPQPRNHLKADQQALQRRTLDFVREVFGNRVLDFWSGLATPADSIQPHLDSGDGVHLADAGHRILFDRVWSSQIRDQSHRRESQIEVDATFRSDGSCTVTVGEPGRWDWRWLDADGRLLDHGQSPHAHWEFVPEPVLLESLRYLHICRSDGVGGVVRVWQKELS